MQYIQGERANSIHFARPNKLFPPNGETKLEVVEVGVPKENALVVVVAAVALGVPKPKV
ncbi:unnamed protein product, partial [Dibothriocephalus latus]